MISFPLYFFLFSYALFFLIIAIFFLINFLHLVYTGTADFTSITVTLLMLILSGLALFGTWLFLHGTDWQHIVVVWKSGGAGSIY